MSQEQQDYLMRQIQTTARGLGKFFGIKTIKDIIGQEELQNNDMTEDEIDTLILMAKVEIITDKLELSPLAFLNSNIFLPLCYFNLLLNF